MEKKSPADVRTPLGTASVLPVGLSPSIAISTASGRAEADNMPLSPKTSGEQCHDGKPRPRQDRARGSPGGSSSRSARSHRLPGGEMAGTGRELFGQVGRKSQSPNQTPAYEPRISKARLVTLVPSLVGQGSAPRGATRRFAPSLINRWMAR